MTNDTIKNINQTHWFKSMDHYPKTVNQLNLLILIVDKVGIFSKIKLDKTIDMDSKKLDILYAVLRIMNKVYNKYSDYAVKKIFRAGLKELFTCTDLTHYDLFFDQLTQDVDHFICTIIKNPYSEINEVVLKNKFIKYLESTFNKTFYIGIMKKLSYDVNHNFYQQHDELFASMIDEFINYTNCILYDTYETMKIFLDKIFSPKCSDETTNEIMSALEKHIDLQNLFKEQSMEIDIYIEQKLYDEIESEEFLRSSIWESNEEEEELVKLFESDKNCGFKSKTKHHVKEKNNVEAIMG